MNNESRVPNLESTASFPESRNSNSGPRIPIWLLCILVLMAVMFAGVIYASVETYQDGVVEVSVHEKRSGGQNIHILVPGVLVPAALHMVPKRDMQEGLRGNAREVAQWLPVARIAARELERTPDGPLVEVIDHRDHVRIFKSHGALVVDVDDAEDSVHISVPVALVRSVADNIEIGSGPA